MHAITQLLTFDLNGQRFGVEMRRVECVVRAVEAAPLPHVSPVILGVINFHGQILPLLDARQRLGCVRKEIGINDNYVLVRTSKRMVAMLTDQVHGVAEYPSATMVAAAKLVPHLEHIVGVAQLPDGLVFIHDVDQFLSLEEERILENAMEARQGHGT
jgi:purine-binding chemotaxis protein CheW